jgi:L-fuconolactonase
LNSLLDSHVHFWDPAARHHDWLGAFPALLRRFDPDDLDPGGYELSGVIFVQADCRDDEALDEMLWVSELAVSHPAVRGIVAYAPVQNGARAADHLTVLANAPLVVGVRRLLQGKPAAALADPALVAGLRLLPEFGLTFDLCATYDQLPAVISLVHSCPETSFVLDHVGKPPVARGEVEPWRSSLAELAASPNVVCKLSGLTTEAKHDWSPPDVLPYLKLALDSFGPHRCMFGSDWPLASLRTPYEGWVEVVLESISGLPPRDQEAVLRGTAANTYGLAESTPATEAREGARGTGRPDRTPPVDHPARRHA